MRIDIIQLKQQATLMPCLLELMKMNARVNKNTLNADI